MTDRDDDDGEYDSAEAAEAAIEEHERAITGSEAVADVNAIVSRALKAGDDFCLVQGRLWRPFLQATGLQPYAVGSDLEAVYRGVRLRESVTY